MFRSLAIAIVFIAGCSAKQSQYLSDFSTLKRAERYQVDQFREYRVWDDIKGKGQFITVAPNGVTSSRGSIKVGSAPEREKAQHLTAARMHLKATNRLSCKFEGRGEVVFGQFLWVASC